MFVSIKGRPYVWFRAAVQRHDLTGAKAAAAELPHALSLPDALSLLLLMAERRDPALDRACTRWVGRFALEHRDASIATVAAAAGALRDLHHDPDWAAAALRPLCEHYGLTGVQW
jgi:hypothetical protein